MKRKKLSVYAVLLGKAVLYMRQFRVLWVNGCLAIFEGSFGILRIRRKCLILKAFLRLRR